MSNFLSRQARRAANSAGQIARVAVSGAAGAAAGAACTPIGLTAVCALGASAVTDALVGPIVERNTRRALDSAQHNARSYIADVRSGDARPEDRPEGLVSSVSGRALAPQKPTMTRRFALSRGLLLPAIGALVTLTTAAAAVMVWRHRRG